MTDSVTRDVTISRTVPERVHQTHAETVERHYERCREAGIPADRAREIARDAADINHRGWDARKRDR